MKRALSVVLVVAVLWGLVATPAGAATTGGVAAQAVPGSVVDIELTWDESGYWLLRADGVISRHGGAPDHGDAAGQMRTGEQAVSMSAKPEGGGYWIFTTLGRVLAFGAADHFGDMSAYTLNGPVLDSVATPTGLGYYMVASDGGVFSFGDAKFYGSMGGRPLNGPVNGLAPTADNQGYWLVADDGGIFSFGSAQFYGSMGGRPLNRPIAAMVGQGNGYLMVGSDGGIFNFGQSQFHGSLGGNPPASPVVAVAPKRDLSGYRMVTAAGGVHAFGNTGPVPDPDPTYEVPTAPQNLTGVQVGEAPSVSLNFDPPANAAVANLSSYEASCDASGSGPSFSASGASSPLTVDVEVGRRYDCQVRAVGSEGAGAWANAANIAVAHPAPANVQVVPGDGQITVSWDAVDSTNLEGYGWITSPSPDGMPLSGTGDVGPGTTSVNIDGLANGEVVWVTVYAESSAANVTSELSEWVSATPTAIPVVTEPSVPQSAASVQGDGAEISVSFTAPAENGGAAIDNYEAECAADTKTFTETGTGSPLVVDVEYGLSYECRVRAHNSEGWGPWADAHGAPVPHPAPANLAAVAGDGEVALSWDAVPAENFASYTVQSALAEDGPWADAATGVTTTSTTVDDLANGTEVWFRVAALSTVPLGSESSTVVSATPVAPEPPTAMNQVVTVGEGGSLIESPAYLEQGEDLSADGRYAVFSTDEDALVSGDTNGVLDVFVRDLTDGTTTRVSVADDGSEANGGSLFPSISADGRYVAFASLASNLDPDHTSPTNVWDVYVRDTVAGTTTNISRANDAGEVFASQPSIAADGQRVAYLSYHDNSGTPNDVDVWDASTDESTQVGELDWHLRNPVLSADGSTVAFEVDVAQSTGFEATNNATEIWVYDIDADTLERVTQRTSTGWNDEQPSISGDGRYVASQIGLGSSGRVIVLRDRVSDTRTQVGSPLDGGAYSPNLSDDGQWLAFHGGDYFHPLDANRQTDVFVQPIDDPNSRVIVPRTLDGSQGDAGSFSPVLSGDGASVMFGSTATNLSTVDLSAAGGGLFVARLRDGSGTALYPDPSTLPAPDPSRPYRVEALVGNDGASELTLTFNPPANAATVPTNSYEAECVGLSGSNPEFQVSGATSPLVVDVDPGMVYNCQARAIGNEGPGPWMWADYLTASHPAPTNLQATQDGGDVTITWDPVDATNLKGYMVVQTEPLSEFGFPRILGWEIPGTSVTVGDFVPGETVTVSVTAVSQHSSIAGESATIEITPS